LLHLTNEVLEATLLPEERDVFVLRFQEAWTLIEVANLLDINIWKVRELEASGVSKLRQLGFDLLRADREKVFNLLYCEALEKMKGGTDGHGNQNQQSAP
jgi:sigma-70-like protein